MTFHSFCLTRADLVRRETQALLYALRRRRIVRERHARHWRLWEVVAR